MEELGLRRRTELASLLEMSDGFLSQVANGKREISSEYKVRCVERITRPGFRFNIFWFEDPEKHPFWVPEDYWMNAFDPDIQVLAQMKPEILKMLERVAKLPKEKQEAWIEVARTMFGLTGEK